MTSFTKIIFNCIFYLKFFPSEAVTIINEDKIICIHYTNNLAIQYQVPSVHVCSSTLEKISFDRAGAMDHEQKNRNTNITLNANVFPRASFFKATDELDLQEFLPQDQRDITTEPEEHSRVCICCWRAGMGRLLSQLLFKNHIHLVPNSARGANGANLPSLSFR